MTMKIFLFVLLLFLFLSNVHSFTVNHPLSFLAQSHTTFTPYATETNRHRVIMFKKGGGGGGGTSGGNQGGGGDKGRGTGTPPNNWPSTTGNPSGGDRSNNAPKK